ncbi:carbohydrate ABC transporter permease [Corticibacterium sp. UT-5YL-CI-8]|nr:carbohydrate ABC transporter permease [Tianweitania sp. UT-5YL-CI-8]
MKSSLWTKAALTILTAVAGTLTVFPVLWMIMVSLKTQNTALRFPPDYLFIPVFDAYSAVLAKTGFITGLMNSLIISIITLVLCLGFGLLAAYSISRFKFRGAQAVLFGMLMTRIFPPVALITPYFLNVQWLGMQDTMPPLIVAYMALNLPLAVWMLKGYFDAIPEELEQCAMVDGATRWQAVTKVTLPLMGPGLAATSVFVFVGSWNEFLFALTLTSRQSRTLPTVVAEFVGDTGIEWPQIMAASTIALAPVLIATFILQRHIAGGMTAGAVKG